MSQQETGASAILVIVLLCLQSNFCTKKAEYLTEYENRMYFLKGQMFFSVHIV